MADFGDIDGRFEFFAVVTEAFFDQPLELRDRHPKLYGLLREFYRVEPVQWFERMQGSV